MNYNNQPFKTGHFWEFHGSPVKILWFRCHGPGSIHGKGTKIPQAVWHSEKNKRRKKKNQTKPKPKLTTFKRLLRLGLSYERYIECGHCPQWGRWCRKSRQEINDQKRKYFSGGEIKCLYVRRVWGDFEGKCVVYSNTAFTVLLFFKAYFWELLMFGRCGKCLGGRMNEKEACHCVSPNVRDLWV